MPTNKMDKKTVTAFRKLFLSDNPPDCETAYLMDPDVGGTQVAAKFDWTHERDSSHMAVYAWLEAALGSREPYDLYEDLFGGDQGAPARGVTIDPGTGLLVLVDAGRLMCIRRGDWIVYVSGEGFSVMPDEVFRDAWVTRG